MYVSGLFSIFNHGAVPVKLLIALCTVESGLNVDAIHPHDGNGHSYGICQVKLATARMFMPRITPKALMRPGFNIAVASKYLRYHYNRTNDWRLAVAAYNAGSVRYNKGRLINANYVKKVENLWHRKTD